jgi:hypothetical protein
MINSWANSVLIGIGDSRGSLRNRSHAYFYFTEICFVLDKEKSKYNYYKLTVPHDSAIIVWNDSQNYEAVF